MPEQVTDAKLGEEREPLPISRLSTSAREALRAAEAIRPKLDQPALYTEIVLLGLNEKEDGPTRAMLEAFGLERDRLWLGLAQRQKWPVSQPVLYEPEDVGVDRLMDAPFSANMRVVLDRASQIAQERSREIRNRHLLTALLENDDCVAYQWLQEMGVPVADVRGVLARVPESAAITSGMFAYASGAAFSDAATDKDALGFEMHADALAEIIIKPETIPPVVIGVYGPWGSGKSTFMSLVRSRLREWDEEHYPRDWQGKIRRLASWLSALERRLLAESNGAEEAEETLPRVACVEYNAWAYTDATKLWAGLVEQVSARLDEEIAWWQRPFYWIRRTGWRLFGAVIVGLVPVGLALVSMFFGSLWAWAHDQELVARVVAWLAAGGLSTFIFSQQRPMTNIVRSLLDKMDLSEAEGVMHRIQKELQTTVKDYFALSTDPEHPPPWVQALRRARKKKLKIVVFIDELDRCPLEKIVDILEAIKLFLAEEIFIVLMAVDTRVAAEAIHLHYKDVKNPELAREYMEKIIQVPVRVPEAERGQLVGYVDSLMDVKEAPDRETLVGVPPRPRESAPSPGEPITRGPLKVSSEPLKPLLLSDTPSERQAIADFAAEHLESNPRRIKRLLNTYRYVKILATRQGERTDTETWQTKMVNWLGLTMRWPAFMEAMIEQGGSASSLSVDHLPADQRPPAKALELLPNESETERLARLADNFVVENPPREIAELPKSEQPRQAGDTPEAQSSGEEN